MIKEGIYIKIWDNKEYRVIGITDHKHASRKGKNHLAKVLLDGKFVNVFNSRTGCYICNLDGDLLFDKVVVFKNDQEYFILPKDTFEKMFMRRCS